MEQFDTGWVRAQFPAVAEEVDGKPIVFFDGPGGTQVTRGVIDAVSGYYTRSNANIGGAFPTSRRTDAVLAGARESMALFLNASVEELVFGPNMTTLTFHLARSIGETIRPGDEIVVTSLDHDANVAPWLDLQAQGAVIRVVEFETADCTLALDRFKEALSPRTKLAAFTHASNAVGTIPDVPGMIRLAHEAGAMTFVDAVQFAPHGVIDVKALDCDFLACSAYKFFGPHAGILFGKEAHLRRLQPHKVRPARDVNPYRWETGTQNHEGMAGVGAAVAHFAQIGKLCGEPDGASMRGQIVAGLGAIRQFESGLSKHLLDGLAGLPDVRVYGLVDTARLEERVPTFAFTWPRLSPRATAAYLGKHGVCCWSGNYYAVQVMERLGLDGAGGAVRVGLAHYNTREEIDRLLNLLNDCTGPE